MLLKSCKSCGKEFPSSNFSKHPRTKDGLQSYCRGCYVTRSKLFFEKNKDYYRKYYETNKEKVLKKSKKYKKVNRDKVNYWGSRRRALKLKATPSWLTELHLKQIENFYTLAKGVTEMTGKAYHVDHVIPLKGKTVCGLHVPWNLQVLPAEDNLLKNNKFEGGWYEDCSK